jgi:2',3'-cyclic-nucleotide 2'-phosphodiesterase (5'-nucleotidase family)
MAVVRGGQIERMTALAPALPGTRLRILATSDLGAATVPLPTSYGMSGTLGGIVELLERERERQPTIWLDVGDLVVGNPAHALLGERPWPDVAALPIAAAAAGNHEFDDGVEALLQAAQGSRSRSCAPTRTSGSLRRRCSRPQADRSA